MAHYPVVPLFGVTQKIEKLSEATKGKQTPTHGELLALRDNLRYAASKLDDYIQNPE